jgi:hypothetical protein
MKDDLKQLIDRLPKRNSKRRKGTDGTDGQTRSSAAAFLDAPEVDERLRMKKKMIAEAYEEVERGEVYPADVVFEGY